MPRKITCFLPCRRGSERVPDKNVRPFYGHQNGLIEIKLKQLLACDLIDTIVLSTNDSRVQGYAEDLKDERVVVHERSEDLSSSKTSTDTLIKHASDLIPDGDILWTHVTSPFITAQNYKAIIECYERKRVQGHDSLATTTRHRGFFWLNGQPCNYDRQLEKWPQTQKIAPIDEINSGAFLSSAANYKTLNDRIGETPYFYELDRITGFDIDYPEDFLMAESLASLKTRAL